MTNFSGPYGEQIRVIGEAAKPQALPYRLGMSLMDVLIAVGGVIDNDIKIECAPGETTPEFPDHLLPKGFKGIQDEAQALLDAGYEDFFSIAANMTEMRTRMERFQGYAEALAANGQLYKAIPIDHNKPSINELTEYFKFKFNPAKRTLIFVQNQWALPRVYKALQPMVHLLPQQIGLLGLNCEDWTNLTTPTVSTIIEPVDQEGREAAEMLLALLDGSSEPGEQRILECKLNWLDSTSI